MILPKFKKIWRTCRRWCLLFPLVYMAKGLLRLLIATCRVEIEGIDEFALRATRDKCILVLWHNRLLILPEILHKFAPQFLYRAVISKSTDGELLAILANSYSVGRTLRVPHNARHQALSQMIKQLKDGQEVLIVTPDGPRGPRYRSKPGATVAAKITGATIFPLTWSASRFWQLNTWDRLILPKPFSKIVINLGQSILYQTKIGDPIANDSKDMEQRLLALDKITCEKISINPTNWPK